MKKLHKYLGLVMLLPFIAWACTGVFFFFKPGYQEAYQPLSVKYYPIKNQIAFPLDQAITDVRQVRTVLGSHLLLKNEEGWRQVSVSDYNDIPEPTEQQVRSLINDAIASNKARYGDINLIDGIEVHTTTGVKITLNWQQMTLRQYGEDTDLINTIYNIHYLRWTGNKTIDQYLGVIGLILVVLLAGIGTVMTLKRK